MNRLFTLAAVLVPVLLPAPLLAATFEPPIPQPQTESAEVWFLVASIALVASLVAVHMLVRRR